MTVDQHPTPVRRLRVVPPPPVDQPCLDLPGIPTAADIAQLAAALRAARTVRSAAPDRPAPPRPTRLVPTRDADPAAGPVPARVPAAVWAVWDDEDLVGVYAEESTARADAAILARDAARAGLRGRSVDCLPLQVFTTAQHAGRGGGGRRG